MQKPPLYTRFVIPPQSRIVCLTLKMPYCTGIAPSCSWMTDYLKSVLSPSLDGHWCLPPGSTFSGNNVPLVVRSGDSGHTIVALITKPCQVLAFQTIYSMTMMQPLLQKPPDNEPIVKIFDGHAMLSTICRHPVLLSTGMASSKANSESFWLAPLSPFDIHTSVRQCGH